MKKKSEDWNKRSRDWSMKGRRNWKRSREGKRRKLSGGKAFLDNHILTYITFVKAGGRVKIKTATRNGGKGFKGGQREARTRKD